VWNYDFVDPATGVGTRPLEGVFTSTVRSAIHKNVKPIGGGVMDAGKFLVVDAPMFVYDNSFSAIVVHGLDRTIEANKRRLEALKGTAELMANWDQVPDYTARRIAQRLGAGAATSYGTGVGLGKGLTALRAARLKFPTACESAGASATSPSTPVGRNGSPLGSVEGNPSTTIGGRPYSGHAIDRMQGRGVPPAAVDNAIRTGSASPGKYPGTTVHYDPVNNISVVVDTATGRVVTVSQGRF
jgi:hypothetical protein